MISIANTMDLPERLLPKISSRLGIFKAHIYYIKIKGRDFYF